MAIRNGKSYFFAALWSGVLARDPVPPPKGRTCVFSLGSVRFAEESLREMILSEQKAISEFSYSVSGILSSSGPSCPLRSENLQELLDGDFHCASSSCMFIDGNGGTHEVNLENFEASKADILCKTLLTSMVKRMI
ncbi:hypothetical protein CK203_010202 [Vitis vinifera]|uniref:Uncharacterized protein n=1 Tax=Vitis vinifera TaxID=29760 RepID=A0A438JXL0_VITVI|nr:hypothetical protein CK203_010202 [Vitis vinifera]